MFGDIIVGVDIGATKVCTVIARAKKQNQLEVIGYGMSPCSGIKKGLIVDLENVARAIKESVTLAEKAANVKVTAITIAISGFHTKLFASRGRINFDGNMKEITVEDVSRVLKEAKNFDIPYDRQVVDVIPNQYIIDGYDEIVDPTGMMGAILEVDADVVLGSTIATQSLLKSVEKAGYQVSGIIVEALASSEVVLSEEEKKLGVLLLDIGGGKTDIAFFKDGRIKYYDSIPVGSEYITNDIVIGLKVSYNEAERLKKQFPLSKKSLINNDQSITIYSIGESKQVSIKISDIIDIVEARLTELFTILNDRITAAGVKEQIEAGTVIIGQGIYHIVGSDDLLSSVTGLPVRFVNPKLPANLKLPYVTALGIVKYVAGMSLGERDVEILNKDRIPEEPSNTSEGLVNKFIKFFKQ
ncbi:MAG: cell division protein FtsA [Clostridia bacterium]|nr:cell division protein FtsA [Clostridia bacterium]